MSASCNNDISLVHMPLRAGMIHKSPIYNDHYNTTSGFGRKWHRFFHSSGLNVATNTWCQVISCLTKAIACHHTSNANQWHRLWGIPATIDIIGNITTFNNVYRFIVNMFYCGRIPFHEFELIDTKGVRWPVKSAVATLWGDSSRAHNNECRMRLPWPNGLEIWLPIRTHPRVLWQQTYPEPVVFA